MRSNSLGIGIGVVIGLGIAALVALAPDNNDAPMVAEPAFEGYEIKARFDNVGNLKVHAPVTMAGVPIGRISAIDLDEGTYEAVVRMTIRSQFNRIPADTSASIFTTGLMGDQYLGLEPGGDESYLKDQSEIRLTQSAILLEQVIGQFLYNQAAGGGN